MTNEFHKPFIKSLIFVAFVTIFAMVSSKYMIQMYSNNFISQQKTIEFSSQKSQDNTESALVK